MTYAITKGPFEFMPDRDDPATFDEVLLEKTRRSKNGTGFIIYELDTKGLPNYFESKKLTLRKLT
jgi:hypothetical protein